jgi:hypothetical protein
VTSTLRSSGFGEVAGAVAVKSPRYSVLIEKSVTPIEFKRFSRYIAAELTPMILEH